jgi:putative nucleotidyltransferase with HDIG domain
MIKTGLQFNKKLLYSESIAEAMTHLRDFTSQNFACEGLILMLSDSIHSKEMTFIQSINVSEQAVKYISQYEAKTKFLFSRLRELNQFQLCINDLDLESIPEVFRQVLQETDCTSIFISNIENSFSNGILLYFLVNEYSHFSEEIDACKVISSHMKQVVEKITFKKQVIKNKEYENLFNTLRIKDTYTVNHSYNVSFYSSLLGKKIGLAQSNLENLKIGALLHDIGKISVPDSILLKPGRLSEEEFHIIKQHPLMGFEILKDLKEVEPILPIVRWHHEQIDGSGYPDGLKNDQIPLLVRIVSLADAFDAMTSQRVYQKNRMIDEAKDQLLLHADRQFDKELVYEFLKIVEEQAKLLSFDNLKVD